MALCMRLWIHCENNAGGTGLDCLTAIILLTLSFPITALLTLYVWQQHVCTVASRSCDFVWDREGDSCGDLPSWLG